MPKRSIYIVKFGGSLLNSADLVHWIDALTNWAQNKCVVVVPGGGEFANAVRRVQLCTGISDCLAHELALNAMRQVGAVIAALSHDGAFKFCALNDIAEKTCQRICLWVPTTQEYHLSGMPEDWTVTSDSIALWLAKELNARRLLLFKSNAPPIADPSAWSAAEYVDGYFAKLLNDISFPVSALSDYHDLHDVGRIIN